MRVRDIMTRGVRTCAPSTSLREAALRMREADCGVLPVVEEGRASGILTDRDVCLALAQRDRRPSEVAVGEAMSRGLYACEEADEVREALATMRSRRIRRLPVVDRQGKLRGMLSINDVIRGVRPDRHGSGISPGQAVRTLRAICEHRDPAKKEENRDVTVLSEFV